MKPAARTDNLLVEEVAEETLIYDLERHRCHALNPTAMFVWRHCDGQTSIPELSRIVEEKQNLPGSTEVVRLALDRLRRAHLLQPGVDREVPASRYSRRQLVRRLAQIGAALPVVLSVVSPAQAQGSCIPNSVCKSLVPPFCYGQAVCGGNKCCQPNKKGTKCGRKKC